MRELKFRAFVEVNGKPLFTYSSDIGLIAFFRKFEYNKNIEQYTGFKNKNGKEIYEGDIISFSIPHFDKSTLGYDGETDLVGKIVFDYDRFCIEDKNGVPYDLYLAEECEVIGNIHENPELLKTS